MVKSSICADVLSSLCSTRSIFFRRNDPKRSVVSILYCYARVNKHSYWQGQIFNLVDRNALRVYLFTGCLYYVSFAVPNYKNNTTEAFTRQNSTYTTLSYVKPLACLAATTDYSSILFLLSYADMIPVHVYYRACSLTYITLLFLRPNCKVWFSNTRLTPPLVNE